MNAKCYITPGPLTQCVQIWYQKWHRKILKHYEVVNRNRENGGGGGGGLISPPPPPTPLPSFSG